jgi:hypothetical protein
MVRAGEKRARALEHDEGIECRGHFGGGLLEEHSVARLRPAGIATHES